MVIYKRYAIDSIWCSILSHQLCRPNSFSIRHNQHLLSLFDNLNESVNTISPTIPIFVLCGVHHRILWSLGMEYRLFRLISPLRKGRYCLSGREALMTLEDQTSWCLANASDREKASLALEGVIKVILFTFRQLDPDVMRFRHDPLVVIGIIYLAIKSQMLNRCRVVKWLMVVQQPILKCNKYTVKECILIISEHQSTNFLSPGLFNFFM